MKYVLILSLLMLTACDPDPGRQPLAGTPGDGNYARYLGTIDGCRLWSVNSGNFYFANCHGGATSTGWSHSSGKTSHYYSATTAYDDQ